jgi:hypothetical protein
MAAAPQKRNNINLLTDTQTAVGVFFQLINSAAFSVVWALYRAHCRLDFSVECKRIYNGTTDKYNSNFFLFYLNYKEFVMRIFESLLQVLYYSDSARSA